MIVKDKNPETEKETLYEWKRKLSLILDYSSRIKATGSLKDILNIISDAAREALSADRCTVFLVDGESGELFSWVAHGMGAKEIRLSPGQGLAGYAVKTKKTVNIKDAYSDQRFNPDIDKKTGYQTKTILCMPMVSMKGDVTGVFQVLNKEGEDHFTKQDEEVLSLLAREAASAIENTLLYKEIKKTFVSFIDTLAETIDARDPMTAGHSKRVCAYSLLVAGKAGYSPENMEELKFAALLHDIGKIGVRESVLTKPGRLDGDEYAHIQNHATMTYRILQKIYFKKSYRNIPGEASSHHESLDGTGYPRHLKGDSIPEVARILAIADVFDALTYKRHYRNPMKFSDVIDILKKGSGVKFDSKFVDILLSLKVADILRVMHEDDMKDEFNEHDMDILADITVDELTSKIKTRNADKYVKTFNRYYPSGVDHEK